MIWAGLPTHLKLIGHWRLILTTGTPRLPTAMAYCRRILAVRRFCAAHAKFCDENPVRG
jgi:hypothetical protein